MRAMIFEANKLRAIQPLDPYQGPRFTKPTDERDAPRGLDQLYAVTTGKRDDYISPTTGGSVSW